MRLILVDDEGTLLKQWNIREEFGDVALSAASQSMTRAIVEEVRKEEIRQYKAAQS